MGRNGVVQANIAAREVVIMGKVTGNVECSDRVDIRSEDPSSISYGRYDCIVTITDHQTFDYDTMVADADLIVDTRNAIHKPAAHVFKLGAPHPPGMVERAVIG